METEEDDEMTAEHLQNRRKPSPRDERAHCTPMGQEGIVKNVYPARSEPLRVVFSISPGRGWFNLALPALSVCYLRGCLKWEAHMKRSLSGDDDQETTHQEFLHYLI